MNEFAILRNAYKWYLNPMQKTPARWPEFDNVPKNEDMKVKIFRLYKLIQHSLAC